MNETFGERLRRIRKERGYTQKDVGMKTGIARHLISHYERGDNEPSLSRIEWLCEALNVTATELLGF